MAVEGTRVYQRNFAKECISSGDSEVAQRVKESHRDSGLQQGVHKNWCGSACQTLRKAIRSKLLKIDRSRTTIRNYKIVSSMAAHLDFGKHKPYTFFQMQGNHRSAVKQQAASLWNSNDVTNLCDPNAFPQVLLWNFQQRGLASIRCS